jgi:hypothetical protein
MYSAYPVAFKSALGIGDEWNFLGATEHGAGPGHAGYTEIAPGERLIPNHLYYSPNKSVYLAFQSDGNMVIRNAAGQTIWNTGTNGKGATQAVLQSDGNLVVYAGGKALWNSQSHGNPGARLWIQDDGNVVIYNKANRPVYVSHTTGGTPPNPTGIVPAITNLVNAPVQTVVRAATGNQNLVVTSVSAGNVPVLGDVMNIVGEAALAPFRLADSIASGQRLDHALVGALKDQLKIIKDVAPYAQMVVSLVPGLGTGVAMALGTGIALAEGKSITEATKAAIRSALPGGPLVQAGFDAALKVAAGENIGKVALEGVRSQLPAEAQKAFDIGLAVVTGEKIQTALANGLASIAPGQLKNIVAAGEKAIATTAGLSDAIKIVGSNEAVQGFKVATGLLSQKGINEKALSAARNALPAEVRQGFDAALKTQVGHTAWLGNIVGAPVMSAVEQGLQEIAKLTPEQQKQLTDYVNLQKLAQLTPAQQKQLVDYAKATAPGPAKQALDPPKRGAAPAPVSAKAPAPLEPPKKKGSAAPGAPATAASGYGPYPRAGTLSAPWGGALWGCGTVDAEEVWGPPIVDMPKHMEWAGRSAVHGSKGRPRKVQGPDGTTYLFSIENGTLTARPSIAV